MSILITWLYERSIHIREGEDMGNAKTVQMVDLGYTHMGNEGRLRCEYEAVTARDGSTCRIV